jgi:hypothetical protein
MKQFFYVAALLLLVCSCKKEGSHNSKDTYLEAVRQSLKDSLNADAYAQLDFERSVSYRVDSAGLYFMRIPLQGKPLREDFLILKTTREGRIKSGRFIRLRGREQPYSRQRTGLRFEGTVRMFSLDGSEQLFSDIHGGYITAFHPELSTRDDAANILPGSGDVLPEVVVIAYVHTSGIDYSTWLLLNSFSSNTEKDAGSSPYYATADGGGGGGGGYSGSGGGGSGTPVIQIDYDNYAGRESIAVEEYVKCFDAIADASAKCSITLYADIPVDSDPNKLFDFRTGSPGHTFIGILKMNSDGTQAVQQFIGFYPKSGWKSGLTDAPVEGKFVDDSGHEFNASYNKSLTPDELRSVLVEILYLKNVRYDIDNYNCTDWALAVFNKAGYGLDIPLYAVPGTLPSAGTSTPQGVYNKLKEMKKSGAANADQISIGFIKGWVADSKGPCN